MDIHLTLRRNAGNTFSGEAVFGNVTGDYDFALDQNFVVRSIVDVRDIVDPTGQFECSFEKAHTMPDVYLDQTNTLVYRKANIYRISGEVPARVRIEYESAGSFTSDIAYNRVSEEMIALDALYINFYPVPIARETTEKMRGLQKFASGKESIIDFGKLIFAIEGFEPYRVINSYREGEKVFVRQFVKIVPFKLLAVDESKILKSESGRVTAYYFNEKERGKAARVAEEASRMIEWFSENLFPGLGAPERMYFISYDAKKLGGFNRGITVELERFHAPGTLGGRHLLAHEIAHYWCMSEPPAVWNEQMLAEGGAEWSHLLYCSSRGRLNYMIDYISLANMYFANMLYCLLRREKLYNIHLQGYRLFKGIYRRHGRDTLIACIRHFAGIEVKTMESFLRAVEANETAEVYASIERLARALNRDAASGESPKLLPVEGAVTSGD